MKASKRWVLTGLACIAIVALLAAYKFFQIQAMIAYGKSFPEPYESVEGTTAVLETFQQRVSTLGEIIAPQSLQLRNELEGLITGIYFSPGDRVPAGKVLIQLDVSEENARLKAARARVNLAQLDLDRVQRLLSQKTVSKEAFDQAQANYDIAQAEVQALQATIARKTLRAPFEAIVGLHRFDVGEFLQANTAIVPMVGVTDYVWVDFSLPLAQASLREGDDVSVVASGAGEPLPAAVIARDPMASEGARTIRFRAQLQATDNLPANTLVKVIVPTAQVEQVAIPRTALMADSLGDHVYVLVPNETGEGFRAQRRQVKLGYKGEHKVGVVSGLQEGELIAATGAFKLSPNELTFVRERPAVASQAAE